MRVFIYQSLQTNVLVSLFTILNTFIKIFTLSLILSQRSSCQQLSEFLFKLPMPKLYKYVYDSKIIARGFTSVVYKGFDQFTNDKVAIKTIDQSILDDPEKKKMLTNQLNIQWQLNQEPYVVQIKAQYYEKDSIFIVTEFCEYGDLKNKIKQKGKFVEPKAVSYMLDIVKAFQTLLKHKIVHRDIKPSNIFISKKGIKIGDFGFAYKTSNLQQNSNIPAAGSPLYMAPQVLLDDKSSSHISDIWSIGVVFFQMLTGRLPFPAKNKQSLMKLIEKTAIRTIIPQKISLKSKQFILRTLKKDPTKRMTPQELIDFQFDDQILYRLKQHKKKKIQQKRRKQEQGIQSNSSQDNLQQLLQVKKHKNQPNQRHEQKSHQNHNKYSRNNPQADKAAIHQQHSKQHQPQKPSSGHHSNNQKNSPLKPSNIKMPPQLQKNQNSFDHLDQVQLTQKDTRDDEKQRFKRKQKQKKTLIQNLKSQNLLTYAEQSTNKNKLETQNNPYIQDLNEKNRNKQSFLNNQINQIVSNYNPKLVNHQQNPSSSSKRHFQQKELFPVNKDIAQNINQNKHSVHAIHQSQPLISDKINTQKQVHKDYHKKSAIKSADSIVSEYHTQPSMKKQQIIELLLNQIDLIRFLSRIVHKIQQIHHINLQQKQSPTNSIKTSETDHHSKCKDSLICQKHSYQQSENLHAQIKIRVIPHSQAPLIYIIMKQFIYRSILQIEKLQFLSSNQADKFFKSQEFQQIKMILDTYITKLHLQQINHLKWKGMKVLDQQLQKQIILIYNTIKDRLKRLQTKVIDKQSKQSSKKEQTQCKQIKKVNRKIQALNYLLVFKCDYLILQRETIFIENSKNQYSTIKNMIENKHSQDVSQIVTVQKCIKQFGQIQKKMKAIKML